MQLNINPRFRSLIPPLAESELAQLKANILQDGCRDPLVTWNGTIVDGHNRYDICTKHKRRFEVFEKDFANEDEACIRIIQQLIGLLRLEIDPDTLRPVDMRLHHATNKSQLQLVGIQELAACTSS